MHKPLTFLLATGLLVIAAASWAVSTTGYMMGGNTIVAFPRPEALPLLYATLALFAIALVVAIHAAVRARMHPATPPETPAPPDETTLATD